MAKKKEPTIEKKLRALYDLQLIDSRIDEIISLRGELPLEVKDLENEIKEMEQTLKEDMSDVERSQMHFALGKALEANRDFDNSFQNYIRTINIKLSKNILLKYFINFRLLIFKTQFNPIL